MLTDLQCKQIERERENGMSLDDVCKKYGITRTTIKKARERGILNDRRDRPQKRDWKEIQKSIDDIGVDETIIKFNVTKKSLYKAKALGHINWITNKEKRGDRGKYNLDQVKASIKQSLCWTDVCRALDVSVCTFNFKRLQKLVEENNISIDHFDPKKTFRRGKKEWTEEEVFVQDCDMHRSQLRKVLERLGHKSDNCEECGITEWNNKPLTIEIDHINGDHRDNRKENLRWLCPNCHSQTETFKKGKVK